MILMIMVVGLVTFFRCHERNCCCFLVALVERWSTLQHVSGVWVWDDIKRLHVWILFFFFRWTCYLEFFFWVLVVLRIHQQFLDCCWCFCVFYFGQRSITCFWTQIEIAYVRSFQEQYYFKATVRFKVFNSVLFYLFRWI